MAAGEAILSGAAIGRGQSEGKISSGLVKEASPDEAVATVVHDHARLVYRIAYAVLRSHHEAEDATQETFIRVWRYRASLPGVEETKTWVAKIAWRVAVDRSRKRARTPEVSLDDPHRQGLEPASSETSADRSLEGLQIGAKLEKLIAALPEKLRQPLILSTIEEMSPREVGAMLGINEAAVRSRVFRARQILREKLAR